MTSKKHYVLDLLSILFISIFPVVFLYAQNADEVNANEIIAPSIILFCTAIVIGLILLPFTKDISKASLLSCIFMILFTNYSFIEKIVRKILPFLRYWHVAPLTIILFFHIAYAIIKLDKGDISQYCNIVIASVFGGLVILNIAIALPSIIEKVSLKAEVDQTKSLNYNENKTGRPNIYYLLFDEYSSFDVINKYFNYDNTEFLSYLTDKKFTVSTNSYNEAPETTIVITNYVNLEYLVSSQTSGAERSKYRENGKLFKLLETNGYNIQGLGSSNYMGIPSILGNKTVGASAITGEKFSDILFKKTIIYPFIEPNTLEEAKNILTTINYLKDPNNFSPNSSTMTMCYLILPHQPFIFDRNGGPVSANNHNNWKDKKFYLEQYIYTTKLIKESINSILENDPNSIIILQSDHSARAASDIELYEKFIPKKDMVNILNAVYYQGTPIDEIKGQSGVNTLRIVFSRLLNIDLPLLEVPEP